jgi:hypothetical protein
MRAIIWWSDAKMLLCKGLTRLIISLDSVSTIGSPGGSDSEGYIESTIGPYGDGITCYIGVMYGD